jgi:CRP/FNR family cyclic AMP-dependent transcriptional regulator
LYELFVLRLLTIHAGWRTPVEGTMETARILDRIHIFDGLSNEEFGLIAQLCEQKEYRVNDFVFHEKSKGKEIYIIRNGRVVIELGIKGKAEYATIHRLGKGEVFGEVVLVSEGSRSASARCETDCDVIIISGDALIDLFNRHTRIGYVVMKNIASVLATRLRKTDLQLLACFLWE